MKTLLLHRMESGDQGTFGIIMDPESGFACYVAEPPWRENRPNDSCIPAGEYLVEPYESPHFGKVYHVKDVSGRSHILQHSGNVAGDRHKGLKTHTYGCQLFGRYLGHLRIAGRRQRAVLASRPTLRKFQDHMGMKPYKLIIKES